MSVIGPDIWRVGCCVVGGGVVGLAVAREISRRGHDTLILESAKIIGSGTSSRNSEVIHAGIYYPTGSVKATMCVSGKEKIYRYAEERCIPHQKCGKLIVATNSTQHQQLYTIQRKAQSNGVHDLKLIDPVQVTELEPEVHCTSALLSPSTGVIDSHALMIALQGDLEDHGGVVAFSSPVHSAKLSHDGRFLIEAGGDVDMQLSCDAVVNAAGLNASLLASHFDIGLPTPPATWFAKGNYYALSGRSPFRRLVYPVPEPGTAGLGVHATIDLAGRTRFGPDVEWMTDETATNTLALSVDGTIDDSVYNVNPSRAACFYDAVRKYWPALEDNQLVPDYSGLRPKLSTPGSPAEDFKIHHTKGNRPADWGGCVSLYGIESPGLTSSMALAEHVADLLEPS
eukprot:m.53846 g.53846  ORF g.53846 m.53846 type:complete len:398 (-) comp15470_c0_seq1:305-1498(-)